MGDTDEDLDNNQGQAYLLKYIYIPSTRKLSVQEYHITIDYGLTIPLYLSPYTPRSFFKSTTLLLT